MVPVQYPVPHSGEIVPCGSVLLPDAVLELPSTRRRVFIECETGTHTLVPVSRDKHAATVRKAERYETFLAGLHGETQAVHGVGVGGDDTGGEAGLDRGGGVERAEGSDGLGFTLGAVRGGVGGWERQGCEQPMQR